MFHAVPRAVLLHSSVLLLHRCDFVTDTVSGRMVLVRAASFRLSSRKSFARSSRERSVGSSSEEPLTAEELDLLKQNTKLASEARPSHVLQPAASAPGTWLG